MIFDINLFIDIYDIELIPVSNLKRGCFFKIDGEYIYTQLPAYWKIKLNIKDNTNYYQCPNKKQHKMMYFLKQIYELSEKRKKTSKNYEQLHILFKQLIEENHFDCKYCPQLEQELKQFGKDKDLIRDVYCGFREREISYYQELIKDHLKFTKILLDQTRSNDIHKKILLILKETFQEFKIQYEDCILNYKSTNKIYEKFKQNIQGKLMTEISFIHFKNIDFKKWFDSLFKFQMELKIYDSDFDIHYKKTLFKKILCLLYILFPEEDLYLIEKYAYVYENKTRYKIEWDIYDILLYHPFLRGNMISIH
jgi:hypothetical protein